jgi:hypothetical protein
MKKYKACEICNCEDCKIGTYRNGSWYCPALSKQICDICCYYDMDGIEYINIRELCKKLKCQHLKED